VFEIVEVVPDPASEMKRSFSLRLRCRDEAKGPVTAVCGIDGYLVSSMGQKVNKNAHRKCKTPILISFQIFVRAFDLDERLVGVAFLDVGVYVTTLRALKNLLIIGDAVKSVWFVAFQVRFTFPTSDLSKEIH
jgi:cleavage and polyadenylation specificity factor subunit 1